MTSNAETNYKQALYMIIDVTTVEETKILKVASTSNIPFWGSIYKGENPNRKFVAPPMAGRSFSKFTLEQLQYMCWNTFNIKPIDDYAELVSGMKLLVEQNLQEDLTPEEELKYQANKFEFETTISESGNIEVKSIGKKTTVSKPRVKRQAGEVKRPASTTTTGMIWDICDEQYKKCKQDIKATRAAAKAVCEAEGINPSTFSTQFGKWKSIVS